MVIHTPTSGYMIPFAKIDRSTHNLPHWEQDGTMTFVTFRLADSLPAEKLNIFTSARAQWLRLHPVPWDEQVAAEYAERFGKTMEKWLDAGFGECCLRDETNRKVVEDALRFFDGQRYLLYAFVVMPNHVHALMKPFEGFQIKEVLRSVKGFTSRTLNRMLGRAGTFWQSESWDRCVRDPLHFSRAVEYIAANAKGMPCCAWFAKGLAEFGHGDGEKYGQIVEFENGLWQAGSEALGDRWGTARPARSRRT